MARAKADVDRSALSQNFGYVLAAIAQNSQSLTWISLAPMIGIDSLEIGSPLRWIQG